MGWVYNVLSYQYLINICKFQGLMHTSHVNNNVPTYAFIEQVYSSKVDYMIVMWQINS